ncbi:transcription elongation factor GreA [Algibacillus agarilyticus]|uniref:transcription elongation factor GreA n=1 Tax=Algibacillus agarilyticus TaxID=2234133 RepID=UPI000DD04B16|nr:transcription elongation factor GreA [Algibacillus agarilyticus]
MQQVPMTVQGAEMLRVELTELKTVRRPSIIAAIADAREHGDLKENAEYHAAREQQGFCEGRIQEIEAKLSNVQIIDVTKIPNKGRVIFGATVKIVNCDTDAEVIYQIVGDDEADIKNNKLSVNSPLARAMIGKEIDDEFTLHSPSGDIDYEVLSVEYR